MSWRDRLRWTCRTSPCPRPSRGEDEERSARRGSRANAPSSSRSRGTTSTRWRASGARASRSRTSAAAGGARAHRSRVRRSGAVSTAGAPDATSRRDATRGVVREAEAHVGEARARPARCRATGGGSQSRALQPRADACSFSIGVQYASSAHAIAAPPNGSSSVARSRCRHPSATTAGDDARRRTGATPPT